METKKISFGFMKTKKAEKPVVEEKKDFIECVEEKSIKVVGGETQKEDALLVIPMKPNTLITADRLKEIAEKVEKGVEETEIVKTEAQPDLDEPKENETLDQMAVRELLNEAKKGIKVETQELSVPIPAKPVLEGQKESTLQDYESVPIQDFGMAMLRGMGWTPNKDQSKYKQPELRPKGLGLGADKVVKENQKKKATNEKGEDLAIVKNSFVKITTGKYMGYYGKVVSLDEDNGRVMVDIAVKKETVSLSEFMMQPVTKAEYDKESKVINADAYEEYKRLESQKSSKSRDSPKVSEREPSGSRNKTNDLHREKKEYKRDDSSNGRSRDRKRSESSSDDERNRKHKKKESANEEDRSRRHKKKKHRSSSSEDDRRKKDKSKKHQSTSSDDSESYGSRRSPEHKKRDIDKKRKGKKKKRDRDRSPNYKKHRK